MLKARNLLKLTFIFLILSLLGFNFLNRDFNPVQAQTSLLPENKNINLISDKEIKENSFDSSYSSESQNGYIVILNEPSIAEIKNNPQIRKTFLQENFRETQDLQDSQNFDKQNELEALTRVKSRLDNNLESLAQTSGTDSQNFKSRIRQRYTTLSNGFFIESLSESEFKNLKNNPKVKKIIPNTSFELSMAESTIIHKASEVWGLNNTATSCSTDTSTCLTGKGIRIGIMDSGIDYNHPDLGGCFGPTCKVIGGYDFANTDSNPMDTLGHGTMVAGITAANGTLKGMAPDAKLYSLKVFPDGSRNADLSSVLAAMSYSLDPNNDGDFSDKLDIVNMSFSSIYGRFDDDIIVAQTDELVQNGVVVVTASGNEGSTNKFIIGAPGASRQAITVGAIDKSLRKASFTSSGPVLNRAEDMSYMKPDISAIGQSICSTRSLVSTYPASCLNAPFNTTSYGSNLGTSLSTPMISGSLALLKQAYPNYTPSQLKSLIKGSATKVTDGPNGFFAKPIDIGVGSLDVAAALRQKTPVVIDLEPNKKIINKDHSFTLKSDSSFPFATYNVYLANLKDYGQVNDPFTLLSSNQTGLSYNLDNNSRADGEYVLKFEATNLDGNKGIVMAYFEVNRFSITYPKLDLHYSSKSPIGINLNITETSPDFSYKYFYKHTSQTVFTEIGSSTWDAANLAEGYYDIKVSLYNSGSELTSKQLKMYLNPLLRKDFPIQIQNNCPASQCGNRQFISDTVNAEDLDGDGKKEIIFLRSGITPTLFVYSNLGVLKWQKVINQRDSLNDAENALLIEDFNGDGKKEISFVISGLNQSPVLYAFDYKGDAFVNPYLNNSNLLKTGYAVGLSMSDVNKDGIKELITTNLNLNLTVIRIYSKTGLLIKEFSAPITASTSENDNPVAVGNIDADKYDELVVMGENSTNNEVEIHAFNHDGTRVLGWPKKILNNSTNYNPLLVDMDLDGKQEIVATLNITSIPNSSSGGVNVYRGNGTLMLRPGTFNGHNMLARAIPADLNKDGFPELIIKKDSIVYSVDKTGIVKSLNRIGVNQFSTSIGIVDTSGDIYPEVLVLDQNDFLIKPFKSDGFLANLGYKVTGFTNNEFIVTDLENDGKAEIVYFGVAEGTPDQRGFITVLDLNIPYKSETNNWKTTNANSNRTNSWTYPTK